MSADIEGAISNHNKVLVSVLTKYKELSSKYALLTPDEIRIGYDTMQGAIETRMREINERRDYIKKCIIDLEKCNIPLDEMEDVLKAIGCTSNGGKISTLHGLCKKTIREYNMVMPETERLVYDFPFNEKDEIKNSINSIKNTDEKKESDKNETSDKSIGGKNKFNKRINTKRKKYRAKNGNNKSKKRRFIPVKI